MAACSGKWPSALALAERWLSPPRQDLKPVSPGIPRLFGITAPRDVRHYRVPDDAWVACGVVEVSICWSTSEASPSIRWTHAWATSRSWADHSKGSELAASNGFLLTVACACRLLRRVPLVGWLAPCHAGPAHCHVCHRALQE